MIVGEKREGTKEARCIDASIFYLGIAPRWLHRFHPIGTVQPRAGGLERRFLTRETDSVSVILSPVGFGKQGCAL